MTDKTADIIDDPKPSTNEKPTTYSKKAQITAISLIAILVCGLVAQTYQNMRNRQTREATAQADAAKREAAGDARKANRIEDFGDFQKKAGEKTAKDLSQKKGDQKREADVNKLKTEMSEDGSTTADAVTEESVRHAQQIKDLKDALAAAGGTMGHVAYKGASGSPSSAQNNAPGTKRQSTEISAIDAKIKEIEAKSEEIEQRRKALNGNSSGTQQSYVSEGTNQQTSINRTNALPNQVFGELATNRVYKDAANSGARNGETVVVTGSILSAVLDMDMMSDYPGNTIAVLQRPFYDTAQENIIFPAGTKITLKNMRITSVNEVIQNRMAITPQWIIRPDGKRIDLKRAAGMDSAGVGALKDQVDRHVLSQILGVAAYAVLGLGPSTSNYGAEPNSSKDAFVREATSQSRTAGRQFAEKYLNIVPTITVRAGTPIKIFIEDDIFVTPWEPINAEHFRSAK